MPSSIVRQQDFRGGEVSPECYGRTHDPRYGISLRTCKNFLPLVHGALVNRAGTKDLGAVRAGNPLFAEFMFSDAQAMILEFTANVVRFWTPSGQVLNAGVPYAVATPYGLADLPRLVLFQSGDVITITHPSYQTRDLTRISNTNWTLSLVTLTPPATFLPKTVGADQDFTGSSSLTRAWNAATNYPPGQYAFDAVGNAGAYIAILANVNKAPNANPAYWAPASDTSRPEKIWRYAVTARWRDAFGIIHETLPALSIVARQVRYTDRPALVIWAAPDDPGFSYVLDGYEIYAGRDDLWGWIGSVGGAITSFKDDGQAPDFGIQPPKGRNPFKIADGNNTANTTKWPGAGTFHEQRRVLARTDAKPSTFFGSELGDIQSHDVNDPPLDSDAYEWRVSSHQLEEIRSLKSFGRLCLFTGQGEFSAQGKDGGGITPNSVETRRHSSHGSSYLRPLEVENALLFNTANGNYVRDFFFDYNANGYVGVDVSEFARHFFRGYTIKAWAHQRVPHHLVWIVRSDGALFSLTYDRATSTIAWAQHETDGEVQTVACIPDGTEDALMLCVDRGAGPRMEKMASRDYIPEQRLACFLDASLSFDGRNTGGTAMKVTGATFNAEDLVTIEASVASFAAGDVNDQIVIDPDGTPTRITITVFTDTTHVTGRLEAPLPAAFQGVATTSWGWARDSFGGLTHLEGKDVAVLADGFVQGPFTVAGGAITLVSPPALIAVVGLPYTSDVELLDIAQDAVKPNVKSVLKAILEVVGSRGIYAGTDFDNLRPAKLREVKDAFGVPQLVTDQVDVTVKGEWKKHGRVCVRQSDPLPLTITAISREVEVGGR